MSIQSIRDLLPGVSEEGFVKALIQVVDDHRIRLCAFYRSPLPEGEEGADGYISNEVDTVLDIREAVSNIQNSHIVYSTAAGYVGRPAKRKRKRKALTN